MNEEPVPTANAKAKLIKPHNVFDGYPPLAFDFFQILAQKLPDTTIPLDFAIRYEEALNDVLHEPEKFGHARIFAAGMRMNVRAVAEKLFDKKFAAEVERIYAQATNEH